MKKLSMRGYSIIVGLVVTFLFLYPFKSEQKPLDKDTPSPKKIAVIFDLGGVLIETNKLAAFNELGPVNLLMYKLTTGKSPSIIKNKLYNVLDRIQKDGNACNAKDHDGVLLPGLVCDWLRGTKTNKELRSLVLPAIRENTQWFENTYEQVLVYRTARMMFMPHRFVKTRTFIKDGLKFVRECKKKAYPVYILSNWDPESMELMVKTFPEIFSLFDGILISGDVQKLKPEHEIYSHFTDQLPEYQLVFIDDVPENIEAAETVGIQGIHCCHSKTFTGSIPDFTYVRKELSCLEPGYIASFSAQIM